ncbi:MAG: single-stranded DNA-binding protein [Candidatus Thermoplasmatota archaeon]|jgi:replication factor A1|nr:single-stranded DNA-binding protein [Candidatus Thermoplasmatota archaeon]MCL5793584.1 single-stranded DNA-binding protein [Candidatus Thermoplasmatota archaeon]
MEGTTKIKDLTPSSRRVNVLGKVISVGEAKAITTRFGEEKTVSEVVVGDETGKIILSLWGDQIEQAKNISTVYIDNGYISLVRGHMRLNVGKYGSLNPGTEEVTEVNESLDMSEKEYENQYRPGYYKRGGSSYGGGGSGGGGYRRGGSGFGDRGRSRGGNSSDHSNE